MPKVTTAQVATIAVLVFLCFDEFRCQHLGIGRCPKLPAMEDFNIKEFGGKWYEVERSFYLYEIASSCTSIFFNVKPSGNIKVAVKTVNRWTGTPSVSLGTANPITNGSAVLNYRVNTRLPAAVARMMPGVGLYTVLDTDYVNYAILWSCTDFTLMHADLVWVLGRRRELPVWARVEVYSKLTELDVDSDRLTLSRHRNCPAF
ncbi:apolipoprotein D [Anabrus simplex]|uniref:apolipoprotein D n=1 Tax=Anabrus simplex TaxID=316456 RepID=UPI0035A31346